MVKEEIHLGDLVRNKYMMEKGFEFVGMVLKIKQESNFYTYEIYHFKFNDSYYYSKIELEKI